MHLYITHEVYNEIGNNIPKTIPAALPEQQRHCVVVVGYIGRQTVTVRVVTTESPAAAAAASTATTNRRKHHSRGRVLSFLLAVSGGAV